MAYSDPTLLTPEAAPEAVRLSAEAGWNQTAADWEVFIAHGTTYGIRHDGTLVASAAALPYAGFGFLSMVLVTPAHRHRGLATRLLGLCLDALRPRGLVPVLDATPLGQPVYEKLGFRPLFGLERWEGDAAGTGAPGPTPAADELAPLDATAFGAERGFLLRSFLTRPGLHAVAQADGFALARPGFRATQIGPIVAQTVKQAVALLRSLLDSIRGRVFLDVPVRWACLTRFLETRGFRRQRPFSRMALGHDAPFGDPARLFTIAGPEFG